MRSTRASWWRGQDLNLRPSGYEPDELPDCSTPQQGTTIMGFWRFLCNLRYPKELIPSPPGRRGVKRRPFFCAKRRMRVRVRVRLHSVVGCRHFARAYPHPPLRGTLSRRERDLVWLFPSPSGRRGVKRRPFFCAKRRMRVRVRVRLHSVVRCRHLASAYPHPPLRGTLSRRERGRSANAPPVHGGIFGRPPRGSVAQSLSSCHSGAARAVCGQNPESVCGSDETDSGFRHRWSWRRPRNDDVSWDAPRSTVLNIDTKQDGT